MLSTFSVFMGYVHILCLKNEVLSSLLLKQLGRSFLIGLQWLGILAMSPLSEAHITKLFAHSPSCFFTLFGVFGRTEALNFNEIQFFNIFFCGQCSVLGDIIFGYLMVMKIFSWKLHCFPFHIWAHNPSGKDFCMQHEERDQVRGLSFPAFRPCRRCVAMGLCCKAGDPELWFHPWIFSSAPLAYFLSSHWYHTALPWPNFHLMLSAAADDHCLRPLSSSRAAKWWSLTSIHFFWFYELEDV